MLDKTFTTALNAIADSIVQLERDQDRWDTPGSWNRRAVLAGLAMLYLLVVAQVTSVQNSRTSDVDHGEEILSRGKPL